MRPITKLLSKCSGPPAVVVIEPEDTRENEAERSVADGARKSDYIVEDWNGFCENE